MDKKKHIISRLDKHNQVSSARDSFYARLVFITLLIDCDNAHFSNLHIKLKYVSRILLIGEKFLTKFSRNKQVKNTRG